MFGFHVRMDDGWKGFTMHLQGAIANLPKDAGKVVEEGARHAVGKVVESIDRQSRRWTPLSPYWLREKERRKWDLRILLATHFYRNHMDAYKMDKYKWLAGVPAITHEPSGLPITSIYHFMEFGTGRIPARPHFRPVVWEMKPAMLKIISSKGFKARVIR